MSDEKDPVSKSTLSAADRAYEHLRDAILNGDFGRGDRLREEHLASTLEVSRTPVREALRRLGAEGLVVIDTHRGAQVMSWTESDVDDIYSIRSFIEPYGSRLAASRITSDQIDELGELMDAMEVKAKGSRAEVAEVTTMNFTFHRRILEISGNERLVSLFSGIAEFPVLYRAYRHYSTERLFESLAEHRLLVRALSRGDGEWADAVMRAHTLGARAEQRRLYDDTRREAGPARDGGPAPSVDPGAVQ